MSLIWRDTGLKCQGIPTTNPMMHPDVQALYNRCYPLKLPLDITLYFVLGWVTFILMETTICFCAVHFQVDLDCSWWGMMFVVGYNLFDCSL